MDPNVWHCRDRTDENHGGRVVHLLLLLCVTRRRRRRHCRAAVGRRHDGGGGSWMMMMVMAPLLASLELAVVVRSFQHSVDYRRRAPRCAAAAATAAAFAERSANDQAELWLQTKLSWVLACLLLHRATMLQQHVRSSSSRLTVHGRQANDGGSRRRLIAKALRSFLPHLQMELETGSISRRLLPRRHVASLFG